MKITKDINLQQYTASIALTFFIFFLRLCFDLMCFYLALNMNKSSRIRALNVHPNVEERLKVSGYVQMLDCVVRWCVSI